jgi:hypothetical protein
MFAGKRIGVFASRQFVRATRVAANSLGPTRGTVHGRGSSFIGSVCAVMALSVVVFSPCGSQASFFGLPRALKYQLSHIGFDSPAGDRAYGDDRRQTP